MTNTDHKEENAGAPAGITPSGWKEGSKEIEELKSVIKNAVAEILKYNSDIVYGVDLDDQDSDYFAETTKIARELIEKHKITLYRDECDYPEEVHGVLRSKSIDEFVGRLAEYASAMEYWAEATRDLFYDKLSDNIHGSVGDISKAKYIVKVYHSAPCWGMGQLHAVVCCKSKDEAEKVAHHVWRSWGDYGTPGGNISTKISEVEPDTEEKILTEYGEDILRYARNYHRYEDLTIYDASDILNAEEDN